MKSLSDFMKRQKLRRATNKGSAFEELIADDLRARGWIVDVTKLNRSFVRTAAGARWITRKGDFFGEFDIIALKIAKSALFIQATTDRSIASKKRNGIDENVPAIAPGREFLVVTRPESGVGFEIHRRVVSGWAPPFVSETIDIGWDIC